MTAETIQSFTRHPKDRSTSPVPLGFVFDGSPVQPEHIVTVVDWSGDARQILRDLDQSFARLESRRRLPLSALRGRLEVGDSDNLRLDRKLGLWGSVPTILWTACGPDEAKTRVTGATHGWLIDDVTVHDTAIGELIQRLKRSAADGTLLRVTRRKAQVYAWEHNRSGTTKPAAINRDGYPDLADFVARQIEGNEIWPGLGRLRRMASGELDSGQAELMTDPVLDQPTPFSLVLRVQVLSFPGRQTPVVVLEISRRVWARTLKKAPTHEASAYAFPDGTRTALRFTLQRTRTKSEQGSTYSYQPEGDFAPIARAFGLPLEMTGAEIAAEGHRLRGCRLFVVYKHGMGERPLVKQGVPDLDKMSAFRRVEDLLVPLGLQAWQGLAEIPTATRAVKHRNQKWRDRDDDDAHRETFEHWKKEAKADIAACYAGEHHIVLGYHPISHEDATRARTLLSELLGDQVRVELIPTPFEVHGARAALPQPLVKAPRSRDYAELRSKAWKPFIAEVRRYQTNVGMPIDGILVLAPEWYDGSTAHDDPVNKRAARITLARELHVPVQYLRPAHEDGQVLRHNENPAKSFETRLMMAWLDLAWKNIGRVRGDELARVAAQIYRKDPAGDVPPVLPPDRVLGVGILRRNATGRLANEKSFVPYAIELDVERGTCSARFAREQGSTFEITPLLLLREALVELAASAPIQLAIDKSDRKRQLQERSEHFLHTVITEFCQQAVRPLVLIDAAECRGIWPWIADAKLDRENILIDGHTHAEEDWGDVRIVRVRTQSAPKVLFDRYFEGVGSETGEVVCYDAPKWADAQLFKLKDTQADVYFSFGGLLHTGRIRGSSCYRGIDGLKKDRGRGTYHPGQIGTFTSAWSTPSAVELTVVRTAKGEQPEQLVQFVEWLRTLYGHIGDWTIKPAPLFFETALKEYLADYDLDEDDEGEPDVDDQ